jgi:nitric oxide reductase activation protein
MQLLSAPVAGNPLGTALQRMLGMGRTAGTGGAGAELPIAAHRTGPVGAKAAVVRRPPASSVSGGGAPIFGATHPEWDWGRAAYRTGWCTVGEFDPPVRDSGSVPDLVVDTQLRAALARLGVSWERHRRQDTGSSLDLSAMIDYRTSVAAGSSGEAKIYEASRRTGRDLGVLVLLDATGSAADTSGEQTIFAEQRRLAGQLTAALDQLGVRVAAYAFYSRGRHSVRMLRVKDFDDRLDARARARLNALEPMGFTRLGAAFRHGAQLLSTCAGAAGLLMIVVGDGLAYDEGYADRYAREDSRRALREAMMGGIACVGVSVDTDATDSGAAQWIWDEASRCVVRDSRELARAVPRVIAPALRAAMATGRQVGGRRWNERNML